MKRKVLYLGSCRRRICGMVRAVGWVGRISAGGESGVDVGRDFAGV